ncbi:MAG: hypothetical protein AVDCRST_MAG80-1201, partial [uncultured Rubrobacteraceae bacterium]
AVQGAQDHLRSRHRAGLVRLGRAHNAEVLQRANGHHRVQPEQRVRLYDPHLLYRGPALRSTRSRGL